MLERYINGDLVEKVSAQGIIGDCKPIMDVKRMIVIHSMCKLSLPVLILGETGTGKENVARAIHNLSSRKDRPFVAVNCASISSSLSESELFGHLRGSFTSANEKRDGYFQYAFKGTVFLDEIGDMPLAIQAKILRVLQFGTVRPVGSDREYCVDVRILAATNKAIDNLIEENMFRIDLLHRIDGNILTLPPLRERGNDILLLVDYFRIKYLKDINGNNGNVFDVTFDNEVKNIFATYYWPGNVRELESAITRLISIAVTTNTKTIDINFIKTFLGKIIDIKSGKKVLNIIEEDFPLGNNEECVSKSLLGVRKSEIFNEYQISDEDIKFFESIKSLECDRKKERIKILLLISALILSKGNFVEAAKLFGIINERPGLYRGSAYINKTKFNEISELISQQNDDNFYSYLHDNYGISLDDIKYIKCYISNSKGIELIVKNIIDKYCIYAFLECECMYKVTLHEYNMLNSTFSYHISGAVRSAIANKYNGK